MMPNDKNTYSVPAAAEAASFRSAETERAYEQALEHAIGIHELDTTNVDRHRVEGLGASMVAAAETVTTPTQEHYFDPTNPEQLHNCNLGVMYFRKQALEGRTRADFSLGA